METDSCNHCGSIVSWINMGGFLYILFGDANVDLNPIHCMAAGWTSTGGQDVDPVLCSGAFLSYGTCDLSGK